MAWREHGGGGMKVPGLWIKRRAFAAAAVLGVATGCEQGPKVETVYIYVYPDAADTAEADVAAKDAPDSAMDGGADAQTADAVPADTQPVDADSGSGCEFAANPAKGEPGATCSAADDCESGLCVETAAGKVCTISCVNCCPQGFACAQLPGNDAIFACLPKLTALCRPCKTDGQCAAVSSGALCIASGSEGAFCGGLCANTADCPGGYTCEESVGSEGAGKQCVATTGSCACSPRSIADGATTWCQVSSSVGTCTGQRKCLASGLTACDAPSPVTETCNGKDDDCDGGTDGPGSLGCSNYYADKDSDGVGGGEGQCLCAPVLPYVSTTGSDCNEAQPAIHPGASELCNGADDDCDGKTDEGFPDTDGDTQADCVDSDLDGDGVANAVDCSPTAASVFPGALEVCDGVDNNCDGATDPEFSAGCTFWLRDKDGDKYGLATDAKCLCAATGVYSAKDGGDCNDGDGEVHPDAVESCNTIDDDCDGATDPANSAACSSFWADKDADGYGSGGAAAAKCLCGAVVGYVPQTGDCDDAALAVYPGALEACNGVDDNCDGKTDPAGSASCVAYYADGDDDGWGAGGGSVCQCGPGDGFLVTQTGDCADGEAAIHPGATEVCNGKDDNCDAVTDEGLKSQYYADGDGDGYGYGFGQKLCGPQGNFTALQGGDCNDGDLAIYPAATDICDAKDNNCDGDTDENLPSSAVYVDQDGDGFGDPLLPPVQACGPKPGYSVNKTDCDDTASTVHPDAIEVLCNAIDDDCAGGDSCDPATCTAQTLGDFEGTLTDWTLGPGWGQAAWAKNASQKGLGYGTGTEYPATDSAGSSAMYTWTVAPGTSALLLDYLYAPDSQEVLTNTTTRDTLVVTVGATSVLSLNPKADFSSLWNADHAISVPSSWWGKTLTIKFLWTTKDATWNKGTGFAVDNVRTTCQKL